MVSCTGLLPAGAVLSSTFHYHMHFLTLLVTEAVALQPRPLRDGLGSFRFARRY